MQSKPRYKSVFFLAWVSVLILFTITAGSKVFRMYDLKNKMKSFSHKMALLNEKTQSLQEDIRSSSDPAWLELTLMEEFGVIPEGSIKLNYVEEK
jgi:hypothetical protein